MSFKNVAIIILLLSITLSAQHEIKKTGGIARVKSMGDNAFMIDPTNILTNPAYGAYYDNFVWGDLGSTKNDGSADGYEQYLGTSVRLNNDFTIGILLSNSDHYYGGVHILQVDPLAFRQWVSPTTPTPQNNTELFGTYKIGNTILGLGVSYTAKVANDKTENINPPSSSETNRDYNQFGLNFGLTSKLSKGVDIEASALFVAIGSTYEPDSKCLEGSHITFAANSRAFIMLNDKVNFIPTIAFYTSNGKYEYTKKPEVGTYENFDAPSISNFSFGFGFDYTHSNFYIVGGPSFNIYWFRNESSNSGYYYKHDRDKISLSWNVGLEWSAASWLIGRVGYKQQTTNINITNINGTNKTEMNETSFDEDNGFTLGVGFKFDNFSLDATVNDDMIRQGLKMIGGSNNTFGYVSLSYAF